MVGPGFLRAQVKALLSEGLWRLFAMGGQKVSEDLIAGPALVVAPHPDDETLGCGCTVARLKAQGARVRYVIVTDGRASSPSQRLRPDELAKCRATEAQQAAHRLGIPETDIVFLGYPDGEAAAHEEKIARDLAAQIWLCAPHLVLAPLPLDRHPDHQTVGRIVRALQAEGKIGCPTLFYPMWFWPRGAWQVLKTPKLRAALRKIDGSAQLAAKRQAMEAYRSQLESLTGEADWHVLDKTFLDLNMRPYEFFFDLPPDAPA